MTPHRATDAYQHNIPHVFNLTTAAVQTSNIKLQKVTEFLNVLSEHYSYKKATIKSNGTDKTQSRTRNQMISKRIAYHITVAVYCLSRTDLH
jgi:hypothetical protein